MSQKKHRTWRVGLPLSAVALALIISALIVLHASHSTKPGASSTIWPTTAGPGSTITVSGSGYLAHEHIQVYFQTPAQGIIHTVTDANGAFFLPLAVPKTYLQGTRYYIHVESPTSRTQLLFNFTPLTLTDPHSQLSFGSLVSFAGAGFIANEVVDLAWNDGARDIANAGTILAGSDGSFTLPLTLPSVPYNTHLKLIATGRCSPPACPGGFSASASLTASPGIVLTPSTGSAGTLVSVSGGGFGRNELINILYLHTPVATASTNSDGAFTASFTLADTDQIGYQPDAIQAVGTTSGVSAAASFLSQPSITLSPTSGKAGTKITVKGKHFTASDTLNIYWIDDSQGGSGKQTFIGNVRVSSNGTFTIKITAPAPVVKGGVYFVQAIDQATGKGAQAQFTGN